MAFDPQNKKLLHMRWFQIISECAL